MKKLTSDKIIRFKHSANSGDLISSLASVKHICEERSAKAVYMQQKNVRATYYEGATHPVKTEDGIMVMMNDKMFEMMKPLIDAQPYVSSFESWEGDGVDFNLDEIRNVKIGMPYGSIQRWYFQVFPQFACDLSKAWVFPTEKNEFYKNKIFVNRTQRYRNDNISYHFLKNYQDRVIFIGAKSEHELFCQEWKLDIPYLQVIDFLELANALASCKFFLGNQSFCYNLAEAMKVPRIVETCGYAINCIPHGADGYDFVLQTGLEYYFNKLNR
jgi:hypothetical protein